MKTFVILSLFVGTVLGDDPWGFEQCAIIDCSYFSRCCIENLDSIYKLVMSDDVSECFLLSKNPVLCKREICIAKKKGFATDDNKIDKNKLENLLAKDFESKAELLADVKSKCLYGNFQMYAPPNNCDFMKMRHCVSMQILNHCRKWKENVDCQEMKTFITECLKILK